MRIHVWIILLLTLSILSACTFVPITPTPTAIPPDATPTLLIGPSSFSGKAVCNSYHFQLEAREDGSWGFSSQERTVMYCGEEGSAFEEAYWNALLRAQIIQREGDTLALKDSSGHVLLRFRSQ